MELLSEVVLSARSLVLFLSAPSQGHVPECRSVELLSEVVPSARPQFFAPSQGGVRECRSVKVFLSVGQRGGADFFPPFREVSLSVSPWNFSARWC